MFVKGYKKKLLESILELLWKQWSLLGVAGQIGDHGSKYVLDPEALLLFSSFFARFDGRLYDLIIDWLKLNGESINIPRLKALLKKFPAADKKSLAYTANCTATKKLCAFAQSVKEIKVECVEPLFLAADGTAENFIPRPDEAARLWGFERNQYLPGSKVVNFSGNTPAALLLRLRAVFGLSARAEAVLALLNKEFCRIQDVAECGKFSWKTASDVLAELTLSGVVVTLDSQKRGRDYFLKDAQAMETLFGVEEVIFPDWQTIFNTIGAVYQVFSNPNVEKVSEKTVSSELRNAFLREGGKELHKCGIPALARLTPETIQALPQIISELI